MGDNETKLSARKRNSENKKDLIVQKYILLREKIIQSYIKGSKILNTVKIVTAILFFIFTIIVILLSNRPDNNKGSWLILWIFVILFDIAIFLTTDYCKQLVKTKVIPYLQNDEQIEFGKYSVFGEDDDDDEDEEDEEENDEEQEDDEEWKIF